MAIYRHPARRHPPGTEFDVIVRADLPRVDIAYSCARADGTTVVDAFAAAGMRGIVVASLAPGVTTAGETAALVEARRRGVLVVPSSRAGSGRVLPRTLREHGFVVADNLLPQKARILAMLALTRTADPVEVQRMFDEY